jgi:hypothetical protein
MFQVVQVFGFQIETIFCLVGAEIHANELKPTHKHARVPVGVETDRLHQGRKWSPVAMDDVRFAMQTQHFYLRRCSGHRIY